MKKIYLERLIFQPWRYCHLAQGRLCANALKIRGRIKKRRPVRELPWPVNVGRYWRYVGERTKKMRKSTNQNQDNRKDISMQENFDIIAKFSEEEAARRDRKYFINSIIDAVVCFAAGILTGYAIWGPLP